MKVKIEHRGWHGINQYSSMFLYAPHGYHKYLCIAENGIIVFLAVPAGEPILKDGEYELPDKDWSYDNPKWELLEESDMLWEVD